MAYSVRGSWHSWDYLASCKALVSITKKRLTNRIDFEVACATTQLHAALLVAEQRYGQQ